MTSTIRIGSDRLRLLRYAILLGIVPLSALFAFLASNGQLDSITVLAATLAAVGALALYRLGRMEYGIMAVALTAGLVNFFTLPTGRESRIVISLAVTFVLLAVWGIQLLFSSRTGVRIRPSPINKPLLAFVLVNIIAYVWSLLIRDPILLIWASFPTVQIAALLVNIALPLLALLVANKLTDAKWLMWLVVILIGIGILEIVSRQLDLPTMAMVRNGTRGLFSMWFGGMVYSQALFNTRLSRTRRALLLALLAVLVYENFIQNTGWVSGWLPLAAACGIITLRRSKLLFAAMALIALAYLAARIDYYIEAYNEEMVGGSDLRGGLWQKNLGYIANHPIFGMGPAGYAVYYMTYQPQDAMATHNNYFDVLAQTGVVGFAVFLWMFAVFLRLGWRTMRALKRRGNFEEAYAIAAFAGCIGALVGMMLGDWMLPFAYTQTISGFDNAAYTWIFLGGLVALYHMITPASSQMQSGT